MSKNTTPSWTALLDRLAGYKIRAIAWYLGWTVVEEDEVDRAHGEVVPITIVIAPVDWPATYCPVKKQLYTGTRRVIRYQRMQIRWWFVPWVLFRLGLKVGKRVHKTIPVHVIPRDNRRSITLGWLEYDQYSSSTPPTPRVK